MAMALDIAPSPRNDKGWTIDDTFAIVGQIAKGGYGAVMLAQHKASPYKHVAVKRTRQSPDSNVELTILKILSEKSYPFILHLRDVYEDPKNYYFVTDYYCGGTLRQVIRRTCGFREVVMKFYAAQLVSAVEFLHKKFIIHLDIKTANILMDRSGNLVLADFGMAVRRATPFVRWSKVPTNGAVGTPGYQSPEMLQEHTGHEASDWWAVGVVCCEMLNTRRPFTALNNDIIELKRSILQDEPTIPETISPECADFLKQLLHKNPGMRLGSCNVSDVKTHPFFQGINWQSVCHKSISPPLKSTMIYDTRYQFYNTHCQHSTITDAQLLQPTCQVQFRKRKKVKKADAVPEIVANLPTPSVLPNRNEDLNAHLWQQEQPEDEQQHGDEQQHEDGQQHGDEQQPGDEQQHVDEQQPAQCQPIEIATSKNPYGSYINPDLLGTGSILSCRPKNSDLRLEEPNVYPLSPQSSQVTYSYHGIENRFFVESSFDVNQAPMQGDVAQGPGVTPFNYCFPSTSHEENILPYGLQESKFPECGLTFSRHSNPVLSNNVLPKEEHSRDWNREVIVTRLDKREIGLPVIPDVHGYKLNKGATGNREPRKIHPDKKDVQEKKATFSKSKFGKYFKSFRKSAENSRSPKYRTRIQNGDGQSNGLDIGDHGVTMGNGERNEQYASPIDINRTELVDRPRREGEFTGSFINNDNRGGAESSWPSSSNAYQVWEGLPHVPDVEQQYKDPNNAGHNYLLNNNNLVTANDITEANDRYNFNFQHNDRQVYDVEELCQFSEMHM